MEKEEGYIAFFLCVQQAVIFSTANPVPSSPNENIQSWVYCLSIVSLPTHKKIFLTRERSSLIINYYSVLLPVLVWVPSMRAEKL